MLFVSGLVRAGNGLSRVAVAALSSCGRVAGVPLCRATFSGIGIASRLSTAPALQWHASLSTQAAPQPSVDLAAVVNETSEPVDEPSISMQAQLVFDHCWRQLEEKHGSSLSAPREIIWLNGAPGSGKGTSTPYIRRMRNLTRVLVVSDLLQNDPECRRKMDNAELVDDTRVGTLLLDGIFDTQTSDGAGIIVDGFPRTGEQVDFLKLLYEKLQHKHKKHTSSAGVTSPRFPRPVFNIVVLYVDEEESVRRQMTRAVKTRKQNERRRDAGVGKMIVERATDNDEAKAKSRYRTFRDHYTTLLRLKQFFPFTLIDAMGTIGDVRLQIAQELRYQSALELSEETYERISHIPVASELVTRARQQLVARLDRYCMQSSELFSEVISILDNEVLPLLRRVSLSGHAKFTTTSPTFSDPKAVEMLIDVLSDREFFVSHQLVQRYIPHQVLHDGTINNTVQEFHEFRIEFEVPDLRKTARRDDHVA